VTIVLFYVTILLFYVTTLLGDTFVIPAQRYACASMRVYRLL
jgi:hypothetical protein